MRHLWVTAISLFCSLLSALTRFRAFDMVFSSSRNASTCKIVHSVTVLFGDLSLASQISLEIRCMFENFYVYLSRICSLGMGLGAAHRIPLCLQQAGLLAKCSVQVRHVLLGKLPGACKLHGGLLRLLQALLHPSQLLLEFIHLHTEILSPLLCILHQSGSTIWHPLHILIKTAMRVALVVKGIAIILSPLQPDGPLGLGPFP